MDNEDDDYYDIDEEDANEYDADYEADEEGESGMLFYEKLGLKKDIGYVGLDWDGIQLTVAEGSGSAMCLDLSKTYQLSIRAYVPLTERGWEHLRFNLTDSSVFEWLNSSPIIQKTVQEIIVCLPEPRGFENSPQHPSRRQQQQQHHHHQQHQDDRRRRDKKKKKKRHSKVKKSTIDSDRGIEGFLRRRLEEISFQTSLTAWFQGVEQFFKNTRPGPFWWPSKTASKFCDSQERFLAILGMLPNLHNVTVIMGPCSRMGYKNLDSLMSEISHTHKNISLILQYVDQNGYEDAYLHAKNCDYEISHSLSRNYEESEAIRRVDGTSLHFFEYAKWIFWISLNLILWIFLLRILWLIIFRV